MLEAKHSCRNGQEGTVQTAENYKELSDAVGKEQALSYANRGWVIAQQANIRNAGQETLTAKRKQAIAKLRENPELAKQMGIDLDSL